MQQTWSATGSNDATLGSTPPLPELGGEELSFDEEVASEEECCDESQANSMLPGNFFFNPFAVSFPGDIPCPGAPAMPLFSLQQVETSSSWEVPGLQPLPATTVSSPPTASMSPPELPNEAINTPDGQFHFIDMNDKKSAMRIRNTRISRQHRQNKVKRIAELEGMLEAALARVEQLENGKK